MVLDGVVVEGLLLGLAFSLAVILPEAAVAALLLLLLKSGFSLTGNVDDCVGVSTLCFVEPVVLDGVMVLESLLRGLGLACLALSLPVVLLGVAEVVAASTLLLLEAGFSLTVSVDIFCEGVLNCSGVSTFCFVEADV